MTRLRSAGTRRGGWLRLLSACLMVLVSAAPAWSQGVIDPLVRPTARAGTLEYEVTLDIMPGGSVVSPGPEGDGTPVMKQRYGVIASAAIRYALTDRLVVRAGVSMEGLALRQGSIVDDPPWRWGGAAGRGTVGVGWRLLPESPLDPRLDVDLGLHAVPELALRLSVSRTRDPVVLTGGLSLVPSSVSEAAGSAGPALAATARAAFVANERVSFVWGITHVHPIGMYHLPVTALSAGVHYVLNEREESSVGLEAVAWVHGGAVDAGVRVTWGGRRLP